MTSYNDHDADDKQVKPARALSAFKKKAKAVGMSPHAYAKSNIHADGPIGKAARVVYTMMGTHGSGKSNMKGGGDARTPAQKLYQIG